MIDIHSHILPGIDDGAKTTEDAIDLCRIAEGQGLTSVIATPHFASYDEVDIFVETRDEKLSLLKEALEYYDIDLPVFTGCELYLDEVIFSAPSLDKVTLNNSRYMLCEFSLRHFDCDEALSWIDELIKRDYVPIISHPERYSTFLHTPEFINEFSKKNVLFQLNADSLTGGNGRGCFNLACEMLENNLIDFIASDAHSAKYRPNDLLNKSKYFPDFLEIETLERLLEENPKLVLEDRLIHIPERGII